MDMPDKGVICIPLERYSARFHRATQGSVQFKTYVLLISVIIHLMFSDEGLPWITETVESKTADKGGRL